MQTQVLPYLRELVKDGHEITLLTFEPSGEEGEKGREGVEEKRRRGEREIKRELSEQGIEWHWLRYHKRPSVPATAFDILNGARLIRKMIRSDTIELLHARSHVPMLMAALARRYSQRKPKLLFDIRGFFPEEYIDAGIWPEGGWLYRTAKRIERWLMKEADGFVVLTEKARTILFGVEEKRSGGKKEKLTPQSAIRTSQSSRPVEVIPCCVDLERFASANADARNYVRQELGISDRKVLVYIGAFGGWYLTEEMADLFAAFKTTEPNGFAMILTQSKPEIIEPFLLKGGYGKNDLLITKVDSKDLPKYLSAADVAVSFIKACYSKQASSPTKNAEYLACGLPIIANSGVGDVDELIESNGVGVLVREFTAEAYVKALHDIEELGDVSDKCRDVARREFDLETVGGVRYRRIYKRLLDGK